MAEEFRKLYSGEVVTPAEERKIKYLTAPFVFTPETSDGDVAARRPYINDRLNSRTARELPAGEWTVRCRTPLEPGSRPKHILHAFDRLILQGDGPWQMFDADYRLLTRGYLYSSDVFLDAEAGSFYLSDASGLIDSYNLADGQTMFSVSLFFGHAYLRTFMTRKNDRMIFVSIERELDQDAVEKPDTSTIEILKLEEPRKLDEDDLLDSARPVNRIKRKTLKMLAALTDETLVAATDNQICLFDLDLRLRTVFNGEFQPVAMSLNNAGIIYLVVSDRGVLKLRAISPEGERIFSAELPEGLDYRSYPPIIGFDNRVYLVGSRRLMAFNRNGHCLWEYNSPDAFGGATITADNQLLVTCGSELGVYDAERRYRTLYEFEGETLRTPPALTSAGELVAATDQNLYCLMLKEA